MTIKVKFNDPADMRTNLPVTQQEYAYPAHTMLVSSTDTKGFITHCNRAFVEVAASHTKS